MLVSRPMHISLVLPFTLFAGLGPTAWAQEPILLDEVVARVNEEIIT